jgi:hypothetical protein
MKHWRTWVIELWRAPRAFSDELVDITEEAFPLGERLMPLPIFPITEDSRVQVRTWTEDMAYFNGYRKGLVKVVRQEVSE